jgi:hypothetical protein
LLTATTGRPDFTVESQAYCLKPCNAKKLSAEQVWKFLEMSIEFNALATPFLADMLHQHCHSL